jgi:DsbC/DsbD-like thiol-disulfide interchange protein/cytochrome c biogenesis protein CcdA
MRRLVCGAVLAVCGLGAGVGAQTVVVGDGGAGPVKAPHLTAEMVSLGPGIAPGGTQVVGLLLTMDEHWHVYWVNAGDSGQPPRVAWTLPAGITAGPMQFPIPERLPLGPLMDFGYEDTVAFPMTMTAAPGLKPGTVHLDAKVDWLVCEKVCIPGKAHLGIDLAVSASAPPVSQEPVVGALGEAMTLIPVPLPKGGSFSVVGGKTDFLLTVKDGKRETKPEFYPYPAQGPTDLIAYAANQPVEPLDDGAKLRVPRSPDLATLPARLHGVVRMSDTLGYEVEAPVVPGEVAPLPVISGVSPGAGGVTAWGAIGLAFVGGIILNLMPCVFPVLFLKGLALVQSAGLERRHLRRHGMVYTLGILVSFWMIVAVLLILRASGSKAGWGFQLQSPVFIALLASFIFLFAMSLAGQFDIGLSLTSAGGGLARREGYAGSFFTGVLATVVATPCTAPLMGAAVGYALAQSVGVTFAVFTALALGLATPYMLLSAQPAWVRLLPRPGAWMEILKQVTAVPLFATAIWLAWVYGQLYGAGSGVDHIALLLGCFLVLAVAGWVLGRWPARWQSAAVAGALIVAGLAVPLSSRRVEPVAAVATAPGAAGSATAWSPYSETALDAARSAGHPVFIDFTAAWCLSCQFNERAVLKSAEVEAALGKGGMVTMKADWTNEDPAITTKLASVGRAGVPTYVVYPATGAADVLPELLSKDLVLAAIGRAVK